MKRLVVAVGLASLLGPLAFSPNVQAQTLPVPIPSVSVPAVPTIIPQPTVAPKPSPSPTPKPSPIPTSIVLPPVIPAPVQTIIDRAPVPRPIKTIIQSSPSPVPVPFPVPGPTRTVFVPGPTRTIIVPGPVRTVVEERVVVRQGPVVRVTVEASPRVTPSPVIVFRPRPNDDVDLSLPEAIGISIGLVALGIALGLLALFLVYGLGFKEAENKEKEKLANLNDELFGR